MADVRLLLGAASYLVIGSLWAYVGLRVLRRGTRGKGAAATRRFAAWWLGLAGHSVAGLALALAAATGRATPPVVVASATLAAVCFGVMFWGLVSYLLYLYTGRRAVFPAVTFAYAVQTVLLVGVVWWLRPIGAHAEGWTPFIDYARAGSVATDAYITTTFLVPPLAGSVAYLLLLRRVKDRTARYRIALVSGSILAWFVGALALGAVPGTSDAASLAVRVLALCAALGVLAAYEPPAWVQRRLRVHRLGHEVVAPPRPHGELAERRAALAARVQDLV